MQLVSGSERIVAGTNCDPMHGSVHWAPAKSLWIGSMSVAALFLGPVYFTWDALLLFILTSGITLCAGHSVGMHRRLIHNSFACPPWLEYAMCRQAGLL
jgi:fatty-acid desaturase